MGAKWKVFLITVVVSWCILGLTWYYADFRNGETTHTERTDTIHTSDTVVIRDTIRITEPKPYLVETIRIDTVAQIDTVFVTIEIERKTYQNEDYKAVIQGYKPTLVSMEVYKRETLIRDSTRINNTVTKKELPKWAVTGGVGIGYTPRGVEPYIGVSVGYVFWSK